MTGYVDAYRAVAAVKVNNPPKIKITQPVGITTGYQDILFSAEVKDPESPSLSWGYADFSTRLVFSSNINGVLCSASGDATGAGTLLTCTASQLSLGPHVITATATDPFGAEGIELLSIWVVNTPPTAEITFPGTGSTYFTSQKINLRGYGFDPDETIQDAMLSWTSNISGPLGTGSNLWVSLPVGSHTITLTARDSLGQTGDDSIVLTINAGAGYPTAEILSPPNNTVVELGQRVDLEGRGTDPGYGDLPRIKPPLDLQCGRILGHWKNHSCPAKREKFQTIYHTITLEVTDSDGNKATHSIGVAVMHLD